MSTADGPPGRRVLGARGPTPAVDEQDRVAADDHESDPAYRALDLAAEAGEIAADVTKSSDDGHAPGGLHVARDELRDALLALCEPLNVDAGDAGSGE